MKKYVLTLVTAIMFAVIALPANANAPNETAANEFNVGWSIYAGWNPWAYAKSSGILKKHADKHGIKINLIKMDYIPSVEAYTTGDLDACVMTNMEALTIPVASGIPTSAVIVGDFSNGNDAILVRDNIQIGDLPKYQAALVEYSVSHYLYARAHDLNKIKVDPKQVLNVSDSDIGPAFVADKNQKVVVTWNPIVMEIAQTPGVTNIFDSSDIPGEVLDIMMINTNVLKATPALGKALTGAWYEVMSIMTKRSDQATAALNVMAKAGGSDLAEYKSQLKTTAMFYKPNSAVAYTSGDEIKTKMKRVINFCKKHKLLKSDVGVRYPDGTTVGENILFEFDTSYMEMAANGQL